MASEPAEATFAFPPALTREQEDEFRDLDREHGPEFALSRTATAVSGHWTIAALERTYTARGIQVVNFEKGKGEDPREWTKAKKWFVTFTTAFLCTSAALGSSIVTGDMTGPVPDLHTTQEIVNLTVTCFVIGFGIGPLFFAPLSEVSGRRLPYMLSMLFFFIFTLPSALARNAATLVIGRQLAGLAASAPICNVGGSMADIWAVEERGIPMATFSFAIFIGPCLGPILGSWIGQEVGWRWIYWVLFIFTGCATVLTLFMPETLASALLKKKAKKLRQETGNSNYRTLEELEGPSFGELMKTALWRPLEMLFTEPILAFMTIYLSFIYSILYLLFFAFPIAFVEIRHFSAGLSGVTFVSIMLGICLAMVLMPFQEKIYNHITRFGAFPEARLFPMMLGAIVLPSALFIFAFTGAYSWVHWIGVCVAGFMFGFALLIIYISGNSYIVDSYSDYAASAIAAKTLVRSEIGAMVPLYVNQMFNNMGFQYAGLLLALVGVLIAPIPFIFYRYGERIRSKSTKASQAKRRHFAEDIEKKELDAET
ncbi:major facilitator superfamily domain-containing protein [Lentinula lateritia]|uniref:Major facilitator superfamily domain-containing protein n=1 Tax=Lentinula aff. lateritia TaxID=2804960 RepID=A0ACC1U915_9AGAR|nr:major facilitator superfamily domain-containing protein [Lentinula aff. lateritia]KAJ3858019.1 major facilitator superfamily domain-containing protein [Lentinula lateritia]